MFFCHEVLTALNIREDRQIKMNNAEVMVIVLTAAAFFGGNFIETAFNGGTKFFPKKIHAVTSDGFVLKIVNFILVFAIQSL